MGRRDWAWLPELALDLIIFKLPCLPDCVRFASVCSSWRIAARNTGRGGKKKFPVPMLLSPTVNRSGINTLVLYSVQENRSYNIRIPFLPFLRPHNARFCGYSLGWLACVETNLSIILFKPSPKDRIQLSFRIPPIMDSFDMPPGLAPRMPSKLILSADPTMSFRFVVIALYGTFHKLAIWRSEQSKCTLQARTIGMVYDALWLNDNLYVVNYNCRVMQIDGVWSGNHLSAEVVCPGDFTSCNYHNNLMESCRGRGQMLQIQSFAKPILPNQMSRIIRVYELDDKGLCREVTDIGGDNLFIGDNCSVVVSASDYDSDIKNCVYYTVDIEDCRCNPTVLPNDMCVFSLESRISETHHCPNHSFEILSPPIWAMPRYHDDSDFWPPIWITPVLSDDWI